MTDLQDEALATVVRQDQGLQLGFGAEVGLFGEEALHRMPPVDESAVAFPEQVETVELLDGETVEVRPDGTRYEAAAEHRLGVQQHAQGPDQTPTVDRCLEIYRQVYERDGHGSQAVHELVGGLSRYPLRYRM